jgi:hypothetical protein
MCPTSDIGRKERLAFCVPPVISAGRSVLLFLCPTSYIGRKERLALYVSHQLHRQKEASCSLCAPPVSSAERSFLLFMCPTSDIGRKERLALYVQLYFIIQTWRLIERMISILNGDGSFNNIVTVQKYSKV